MRCYFVGARVHLDGLECCAMSLQLLHTVIWERITVAQALHVYRVLAGCSRASVLSVKLVLTAPKVSSHKTITAHVKQHHSD